MKTTFTPDSIERALQELNEANARFLQAYPGESSNRQPVHTVYGGAQLFKSTTTQKMGALALKSLADYAPNFVVLAHALKLPGHESFPTNGEEIRKLVEHVETHGVDRSQRNLWLASTVYQRVVNKVEREAVEDFRIDFEDGFGIRPDAEEDEAAHKAALEVAKGMNDGSLSPFIGIRIKPFNTELVQRSVRTLDLFLSTLLDATGDRLPENFVITLPKVQIPEQVSTLVQLFDQFEAKRSLPSKMLKMEIMIETTQSIINPRGESTIRTLVNAAEERCVGAHFGTYDYTASSDVTARYQVMDNPVCDFARHNMKVALAGTGIFISDGATNVMPVAVNRPTEGNPLTPMEVVENVETVHSAWKLAYDHTQHSLKHAFYQGWDLHPAQLPIRYAAIYTFFLEGFGEAATRLRNFLDKAAQATLSGEVFDDAATGQGLLNYFIRALTSGAITEEELGETGLSLEEFRTRSFAKILQIRSS